MSELGDVLVLLHDAAGRITTLSATLREWWDDELRRRATAAMVHNRRGMSVAWLAGGGRTPPPPRYRERSAAVHYQRPGRYRCERQPVATSEEPAMLQVCDGTREWMYLPDQGEAWVQHAGADQVADDLLDPAWLPADLVLGVAGRFDHEGRAAIELHGHRRLRQGGGFGSRAHPAAEEVRAVVDADSGLLLELTNLFEGQPLSRRGLHDLALGIPLDEALFRFTPPAGTRVRDVDAHRQHLPARLRWRLRWWRRRGRPVASYSRSWRLP